ncbi:MAG: 16S rRNA (cytidine(1402)-2'-O)-methyltransferase [Sulfuriflexus sp.]|nr:16S rRNA (cytidine(1402)-2'-O)-methyltransferase [Sulfuriflexus sp.]
MNDGTLYIVATPIGHLGDLSPRAVEVLSAVDVIAAEDTRVTRKLLQHMGADTAMLSLHEHNEQQRIQSLLARLQAGDSVALVSDAGTPLISDPGYPLVRAVRQADIKIVPVPGPCAVITALSVSGLPTDKFIFEGFLPGKSSGRRGKFEELLLEHRTLIFYESPHRILACLEDLEAVMGDHREVVIARELTKTFETIRSGNIAEIREWVEQDQNQQRGEIVLLVAGAPVVEEANPDLERILTLLMDELPLKQAAALTAQICDAKRNEVYQKALEIKEIKAK